MKKFLLLTIAMLIAVSAFSQTQKGIAKTKGRLDNDGNLISGEPLSEVTIKVKDRNAVMSDKKGSFTFPTPENTYYLEKVTKNGYVLTDPDILSKQYTYSPDKLVVVLETKENQLEERFEINRKIMAAQKEMIDKLRAEVKQLKAENKITEEEYYKKLQDIVDMQNENQQLVEEMVDRYSKIDFDQLSDFDRQIKAYILNGELVKAKNLVLSKGDLTKRAEDLKTLNEANAKEREEIEKRSRKLEKSEALAIKERDDLANDYYNLFEIYKMEHKNDSAAYYLELRAALDTTNVDWMFSIGEFYYEYIADYEKALDYCQIALRQSIIQHGEYNKEIADLLNNVGVLYLNIGDIDNALAYYNKALIIRKALFGDDHYIVAESYNNLGNLYTYLKDFEKALEYHNKALSIRLQTFGAEDMTVSESYHNIGGVYNARGDYHKALELFKKAMEIRENNNNEANLFDLANSYRNIAITYYHIGDCDKAKEYMNKAISIQINIYGEINYYVSASYDDLGFIYQKCGEYDMAYEAFKKELFIRESLYGTEHPLVIDTYNSIGRFYLNIGNYDEALKYSEIALSISMRLYGENDIKTTTYYTNHGYLYFKKEGYSKAVEYFNKAYDIRRLLLGDNHPKTQEVKNIISEVQQKLEESKKK